MHSRFLVILLIIFPLLSFGQNEFSLNSRYGKEHRIVLNGDTLLIDTNYTKIQSNYPQFDTLILLSQVNDDSDILCNFKPDSLYSLFGACCGSIDVIPSWKVEKAKEEGMMYDEPRYQELLMDLPSFTLKVINNVQKDSIYAWYVDHACFPSLKLLTYEDWHYGSPVKCFYWNNISAFTFFTSTEDYSEYRNEETQVVEDIFPYPNDDESIIIEKKATVLVRLFDNDNYVLSLDVQTSEVKLEKMD